MNPSNDDPDDLVRKKYDLNHITNMSYQMHVPDSITVGPDRPSVPRLHQGNDHSPVRMEVPNSIRLGGNNDTGVFHGSHIPVNNASNHTLDSTKRRQQHAFNPSDIESPTEDDYTTIDIPRNNQNQINQQMKASTVWDMVPHPDNTDANILNKLQLLQNRIQYIERTLARRDYRDRIVYTCIIGYFLLQALLSLRRSMLH